MAAETAVTPLDVALELVAVKVAIVGALEMLAGVCPVDHDFNEWAYDSPVPLPEDPDPDGFGIEPTFQARLDARSSELSASYLRAVGAFLTAKADRLEGIGGAHGR